jgi:DNA repair exonuclease SbcCD ATPase subunit
MNEKDETPLTDAASRIEEELSRFERQLRELSRPVNSEKALQRARVSLEQCSESEERLAAHLTDFARAIQSIQERQQRCMEALGERANEIQARHADRAALIERMASLGLRTSEISKPIASLEEKAWDTVTPELVASVGVVSSRLEEAIGEAGQIAASARDSDWSDLARDADVLKQQLQAVRNQLLIGQRKLASRAPS